MSDKMGKVILVIVFVVYYVLCIGRISGYNESDDAVHHDASTNAHDRRNVPVVESESVGKSRKKDHHQHHHHPNQNRRSRGHRQKSNKDGKTGCGYFLLMVITSYYIPCVYLSIRYLFVSIRYLLVR